jgi:hypothetical protein
MTEARIWNVAHNQAELQAGMNKRLNVTESNLVAYYPLNGINLEISNNPRAIDLSGGNHCTANNVSVVYDNTLPLQKSM